MIYRLAKSNDYNVLADIHYSIRNTYDVGIFSKLGKSFLKTYYQILLNDPYSVVICAEKDGFIYGFCSATLDINAQMKRLKNKKFHLGLAASLSIIKNPTIIKHLYHRFKHINDDFEQIIISKNGARSEYWAWRSSHTDPISSVQMYNAKLNILKSLGVKDLYGEVDLVNKNILKFQLANGSKIISKHILPDGRERVFLKTSLVNWKEI